MFIGENKLPKQETRIESSSESLSRILRLQGGGTQCVVALLREGIKPL